MCRHERCIHTHCTHTYRHTHSSASAQTRTRSRLCLAPLTVHTAHANVQSANAYAHAHNTHWLYCSVAFLVDRPLCLSSVKFKSVSDMFHKFDLNRDGCLSYHDFTTVSPVRLSVCVSLCLSMPLLDYWHLGGSSDPPTCLGLACMLSHTPTHARARTHAQTWLAVRR
jgi:hypothetical protein